MKAVFDALRRHAAERPDTVAFRDARGAITWAALAAAVGRHAAGFANGPQSVGLALTGIDYVIADLAATLAGRRVVPVPAFFSATQIAHLLDDAGAVLVNRLNPDPGGTALPPDYRGGSDRVIYTSGTTGRPKGVVLGDRQIDASLRGLAGALRPGPADRYLSVLPQSQLLEQICGIFLPVLAGAETVISPEGLAALMGGDGAGLARAASAARPTITVLAPRQLTLWVSALRNKVAVAPDSLRYVAVGGAPVSPDLLAEAQGRGLPAAEGYGLSEACSVVALTPAGNLRDGSAMSVIDGLFVEIEEGEIVVSGPTVMRGYLHGAPLAGDRWRTGDLGRMQDGRLQVLGRRDALIVRQSGRNIAPEWVEAEALADPAILAAALVPVDCDQLVLVMAAAASPDMRALTARLHGLPDYARPDHLLIADPRVPGLLRPSGNADRLIAGSLARAQRRLWLPLPIPQPERVMP